MEQRGADLHVRHDGAGAVKFKQASLALTNRFKTCKDCKQTKPVEQYYTNSRDNTVNSRCMPCDRVFKSRHDTREKANARMRRHLERKMQDPAKAALKRQKDQRWSAR